VRDEHLRLARRTISTKRLRLDELLHNIPGVRFFFSAITAIEAAREDNDDAIFPAVAYFIVYSQSDVCNQETIFRTFHDEDTEADVLPIKARQRGDGDDLAFRLFNVVKDHSNGYVNAMVAASNRSGIQRQLMNPGGPSTSSQQPVEPQHLPETSTRIVVVDAELGPAIHAARQNLEADGFKCEVHSFGQVPPPVPQFTNTSGLTEAIRTFKRFLELLDNALYKVKHY
jgi:hypothetical protein